MIRGFKKFQKDVAMWVQQVFGTLIANDIKIRNHRFIEESFELVQSLGATKEECLCILNYVYSRPLGEPDQEVGGVMITLAALCTAADIKLEHSAKMELSKIWNNIEKIKAKSLLKPSFIQKQ